MCCVLAESSFFLRIFLHRANIKHGGMMSVAKGDYYELLHGVLDDNISDAVCRGALFSFNH